MLPTIPKLCGVKRSVLCTLVSTWGIIMLGLMGLFLSAKSIAFIEDIEIDEKHETETIEKFYQNIDRKYEIAAGNCYLALLMYGITFVVSAYHWSAYHQRGLV